MNMYKLTDEFNFGKYKGKTIEYVVKEEPSYIQWCILNLYTFYISIELLQELVNINPKFIVREEVTKKLKLKNYINYYTEKKNKYEPKNELDIENNYETFKEDNYIKEKYGSKYEKYNSYNGWSDDAIDDVFNGDPEATWNLD